MQYKHVVIGLGNTGSQIVKLAATSDKLTDTKFYAIDSVASSIDMKSLKNVTPIPIISDENTGSGRVRERGAEMMRMHLNSIEITNMIRECNDAALPVVVISSSAGGTGSGAIVPLCRQLLKDVPDITLIPIIIVPAMDDPIAYHMNTSDLFTELGELGLTSYSVFRNKSRTSNYTEINQEVVTAIEIMQGKWYESTNVDSIDDSDRKNVFSTPGRLVIVQAEATNTNGLVRSVSEKVLNGNQPWVDPGKNFGILAFSLKSTFAKDDIDKVFDAVRVRCMGRLDEYKDIVEEHTDTMVATCIVSGLPNVKTPDINIDEFHEASGIADGMKKSSRPSFLNRNKTVSQKTSNRVGGLEIRDD